MLRDIIFCGLLAQFVYVVGHQSAEQQGASKAAMVVLSMLVAIGALTILRLLHLILGP